MLVQAKARPSAASNLVSVIAITTVTTQRPRLSSYGCRDKLIRNLWPIFDRYICIVNLVIANRRCM